MVGQLFFMAKAIENIPFFLYHMYSQAHPTRDSIAVYLIKTPDGYFNHKKFSSMEQEILMNSVSYYVNLKRDGDGIRGSIQKRFGRTGYTYLQEHLSNDSASLAQFPGWWARYFRALAKNNFDSVSVIRSYVYSKPPYNKAAADSLIFTIKLK